MTEGAERYSAYRWVILSLAWAVLVCMIWSWFLIPSLAFRLFPELNLTHAQFTLILTAPFLIGVLTPLPGGALGDRFGIKIVVGFAAFIAAVSGLARLGASNFETMFILMCVFGIAYGIIMPNLPKLVGIWFPPRQVGLASGIYMTGLNFGAAFGLLTAPWFGGWRPAFGAVGVLMFIIAVLWVIFARNAPRGAEIEMPSLLTGVRRGMKSGNVWLIAIGQCLYLGAFVGFSGNFPAALERVHHMTPQAAGAIASLLTWGLVLGNFFLPMVSDRVGRRKVFIYFGAVAAAVCVFLAWYAAPGPATWFLIFIGGVVFGSIQPVLFTVLVELPELDADCLGGASGLVTTLLNAGGFFVPLLITSPLVAAGTQAAFTKGFLVTALSLGGIVLATIFLRETGLSARKNVSAEREESRIIFRER